MAGNAKATGPNHNIARWSCLHAGHVSLFCNVWPAAELDRRVRACLHAVVKCNHAGVPG
ncbi:hypothetical protein [Crossiella sp. NPDC003009]